jgi:hypothetical protein
MVGICHPPMAKFVHGIGLFSTAKTKKGVPASPCNTENDPGPDDLGSPIFGNLQISLYIYSIYI